jgi:hypothetical protein
MAGDGEAERPVGFESFQSSPLKTRSRFDGDTSSLQVDRSPFIDAAFGVAAAFAVASPPALNRG